MKCIHKTVVEEFLYGDGECRKCNKDKVDRRRLKGRRHYQRHKEKVLEKCAEYRRKNPEKIREMRKHYNEKKRTRRLNDKPTA